MSSSKKHKPLPRIMLSFSKSQIVTINYSLRGWHSFCIPAGTRPSRAEPNRAEPSRAESSRAGPCRAEPSQAEPIRAGPGRARAEPSRDEPQSCILSPPCPQKHSKTGAAQTRNKPKCVQHAKTASKRFESFFCFQDPRFFCFMGWGCPKGGSSVRELIGRSHII